MRSGTSVAAGLLVIAANWPAHAQAPSPNAPTPRPAVTHVQMQSYSTASRMGYAHLVFRPEGTDVVVQVPPANGLTLPMHLYTYVHQGSCTSLGPRTAPATGRVLGYREPSGLISVRNAIALSADTVRASPHALAVWSSPADGNQMLYCADLRLS